MLAHYTITFMIVSLALLCPPAMAQDAPPRQDKQNILFIISDDHAAHAISAYGSTINTTPNIDRLAREGVRLTNCFCENALCSPSRAAIMTGSFSCRHGALDLTLKLAPAKPTFPPLLHEVGYQT